MGVFVDLDVFLWVFCPCDPKMPKTPMFRDDLLCQLTASRRSMEKDGSHDAATLLHRRIAAPWILWVYNGIYKWLTWFIIHI